MTKIIPGNSTQVPPYKEATLHKKSVKSKTAAEKFYFSDEYQAAKAIRDKGVDTDLMIIEGL